MALLFAKEGNDLPRTKAHKADNVHQNQKIMISAAILLKLKPVTLRHLPAVLESLSPNYQFSCCLPVLIQEGIIYITLSRTYHFK